MQDRHWGGLPAAPAGTKELDRMELALIRQTLAETGNNQSQAARRLGVSRSTLWRKLKQIHGEH
jgi:DNA-binding NtrC family response regulator